MKTLRTLFIGLVFSLITGVQAYAQEPTTHLVKEGETLMSIAKQYRVTPFNILKFNKDIKRSEELIPGTVLVIPVEGGDPPPVTEIIDKDEPEDTFTEQRRPENFITHKVRKKETLFWDLKTL